MALSKEERQSLRQQTHNQPTLHSLPDKPKHTKKIILFSSLSVLLILVAAGIGYGLIEARKPGLYDDFASCLTEQGAEVYGASWCQYTTAQKDMFGKSFKHVDYHDYKENQDVRVTPTWFVNGEKLENVQSFDRLAALTGCEVYANR